MSDGGFGADIFCASIACQQLPNIKISHFTLIKRAGHLLTGNT